ncbi:hypothetical protein Tco_0090191 [Tanacetum coccineum]
MIKRVKKLEQTIKISQARRRAKVVISDAEEDEEDPSEQGRSLIEELDLDARISLLGVFSEATDLADAARRRQSVENVQTYTRRSRLVSIADVRTADVSAASELGSTAGVKANDKGKAIMQEFEPQKKIKKRVQVQMSVDEELAKKVFEEEKAKFKAEHQQEKSDFETTLELQKQLDEREEVVAQSHNIDWSDPDVLRYHTLQNRPFSVAEVRKNMYMYLKNHGGYKLSHFKGMSYEDVRPIFERVWDQNQAFVPRDSEIKKESIGSRKKSLARKRARETLSKESAKKQKLEDNTEKEELQVYLNIVPKEENTGFVIHMMVEKKYPLSQDTLSKMLNKRLEVDHQSKMGYELIRRKISTASTELNTARRLSTAA